MNVRAPSAILLASAVLALVFAFALSARALDVSFDVQPRLLNLGETAQATLTFHGARSAPNVDFPPIDGLQITGTGQQMQFGTGGSQVSLTYNLFAQKPGRFVIGPYQLDYNGEQIQIPAKKVVKFRVAKAAKDAILGAKK